jgi:hypothetical protein
MRRARPGDYVIDVSPISFPGDSDIFLEARPQPALDSSIRPCAPRNPLGTPFDGNNPETSSDTMLTPTARDVFASKMLVSAGLD